MGDGSPDRRRLWAADRGTDFPTGDKNYQVINIIGYKEDGGVRDAEGLLRRPHTCTVVCFHNMCANAVVIDNSRPFSDFDRISGLALLGMDEVTSDKALFASDELDLGKPLPHALTRLVTFARWSTVRDVLQHLAMDMAYRVYTTPPADIDREACLRDLISPVLSAAALLVEAVKLVADFSMAGLRSHGSIDWVLQFKKYNTVVIAAKLGTVFTQHVGQLAAEMLAARESYAMKVLGKRKQDAAKALEQFFKYVAGPNGQRKLVASKMVDIMLTARDLTDIQVLAEISGVLGPLVHIVRAQHFASLHGGVWVRDPVVGAAVRMTLNEDDPEAAGRVIRVSFASGDHYDLLVPCDGSHDPLYRESVPGEIEALAQAFALSVND
ncbi:hypothetical protein JKP88DRAFT_242047 [Tribonema minus]|uniref:Uncharacterized protein n=1 Tax=Tribonema minus TaxID=303371 RepID=A0A835YNM7_9STRA|nr:hypothetical protein JKP88DRAFT_242047 [Tribonema minus]